MRIHPVGSLGLLVSLLPSLASAATPKNSPPHAPVLPPPHIEFSELDHLHGAVITAFTNCDKSILKLCSLVKENGKAPDSNLNSLFTMLRLLPCGYQL